MFYVICIHLHTFVFKSKHAVRWPMTRRMCSKRSSKWNIRLANWTFFCWFVEVVLRRCTLLQIFSAERRFDSTTILSIKYPVIRSQWLMAKAENPVSMVDQYQLKPSVEDGARVKMEKFSFPKSRSSSGTNGKLLWYECSKSTES